MIKTISTRLVFALFLGFIVAIGCSDANAQESTYLPIYEPCPFDEKADDSPTLIPDHEAVKTEHVLDAGGDEFDEALWQDDEDVPFSEAAPFMGSTPAATPASAPAERPASNGVDINGASADELTELPGIGPALAERIVEYRQDRRFDNPTQLQRVEGIGPATFEQIAPLVEVR